MKTKDFQVVCGIHQLLTLEGVAQKKGRHPEEKDLGIITDAALVTDENSQIVWLGKEKDLPSEYQKAKKKTLKTKETWIPELVECHTHLVFGGERIHDFSLRCQGLSYQEVAAKGGGILSTVRATREASASELLTRAQSHLDAFKKTGVGTLEIKSGYGLTLESEIKILDCIQQLNAESSMEIHSTFLPAHAIPSEFQGKAEDYVNVICKEWIPEVKKRKLASTFDVFIEKNYFNLSQTEKLLKTAKEHGFGLKLHTDQFSDLGGTALAVSLGALSCDHLDQISEKNIKVLANSETVAVLCPGASLFAGTSYPPARKLIDAGARVALSTDFNPGTSPCRNLKLMTTLGCTALKMTPAEVLVAVTYNAAAALGIEDRLGTLSVGKTLRVTRIEEPHYASIPYWFGEV